MKDSAIEWTHHTFNPWRGCTKVSPGCANCYAETLSGRNHGTLGVWGPNGTRVVASESMWREPVKWNAAAAKAGERHRVFCASLADVFEDYSGNFPDNPPGVHGGVRCMVDSAGNRLCTKGGKWAKQWHEEPGWRPLCMNDVRDRLFKLIDATPHLDWLLLTKRPENVFKMMPGTGWIDENHQVWPVRPNVWLGTSVENQQTADERIPHLLKVPAAVRFLSMEPLLGPVDLTRVPVPKFPGVKFNSLLKYGKGAWGTGDCIDWVIAGGESGSNARPMHPDWARSVRDQCQAAGVPFFMKQMGGGRDKGGDFTAIPTDLQVREFPNADR